MKRIVMAICVCLTVLTLVGSAFAAELWDWHLRGADEGVAAGALPPPGAYFVNDFYWAPSWKLYGNDGHLNLNVAGPGTEAKLAAFVDIPVLVWVPGLNILGASYGAAIAQPFDFASLRVVNANTGSTLASGQQWGAYNTVFDPIILSWDIPYNFHVSAAFQVGFNDGTSSVGESKASATQLYSDKLLSKSGTNAYAWSSNNAYTFTPVIGLSWLYNGWNVSAEFMYTFWTKDNSADIQNGDQFGADYTVTYSWNRWIFGLGAAQENQVYNDKGNVALQSGALSYGKILNSENVNYSMGPIIGYNFGPCSLMFTYNFALKTKNDVGGDWAMLRLVVPLGNPSSWY